ncbi:MAG: hypothetical protein H7Y42_15035 [Chitinophagaceae bacterium]|nr:hypothetical protein [Chitinophagaceae bacterium]
MLSVILGEVGDITAGDHLHKGKLIDIQKRYYFNKFQTWRMPEQKDGYIKPRDNDPL